MGIPIHSGCGALLVVPERRDWSTGSLHQSEYSFVGDEFDLDESDLGLPLNGRYALIMM